MSQTYSGIKTQIKIPGNQRNTNNLRFNQPDSQNRSNFNQNKNHNWNQGRQFNPQYISHNQWNSNKAQQNKPEPMEVD